MIVPIVSQLKLDGKGNFIVVFCVRFSSISNHFRVIRRQNRPWALVSLFDSYERQNLTWPIDSLS